MLEKLVTEEAIIPNGFTHHINNLPLPSSNPPTIKKKRNLPGTPDPEAEVIALSPKTLMATNRFLCEICGKGFQRDQNLQLHRRGHNLPWKLKQRTSKEVRKRVYVCPEKSCVHNHPSRALGDLTGIKKHFCRKHGEKKWKCAKCSKCYAVQSDWKAHSKTCGTREYKCDCGTLFSRRDSFITHRAFCEALAEETARVTAASNFNNNVVTPTAGSLANINYHFVGPPVLAGPTMAQHFSSIFKPVSSNHLDPTQQGGLSLWASGNDNNEENNNHNNLHNMHDQIDSVLYADPHQNHPPVVAPEYHSNWGVFGSMKTTSDHEVNVSAPSLFSTQNLSHQTQPTSASMSATALLQKAAQMGSTSSTTTNQSSFLGSFGLKSTNNGAAMVSGTSVTQLQDENKFCGLYATSSMMNNCNGSDLENEFSSLEQMFPPAKRRRIQMEEHHGGQTRDFLGVGIQPIGHPRMRFDHV